MASEKFENSNLQDIISICPTEILKNLKFKDLKNLRLANKCLYNTCNDYINENTKIKVNVSHINYNDLWRTNSHQLLKASAVSINWSYADSSFLSIPNQFRNITKFFLTFHIGGDFDTFDVFFSQLPNLKYFGFTFPLIGEITIDPDWWNTNHYPNLEELEIVSTSDYIPRFNFQPMCNFLQRHRNIHTLHTQFKLFHKIYFQLIQRNIELQNLYIDWNWYLSILHGNFLDIASYYFHKWFEDRLYKNVYLQTESSSEDIEEIIDHFRKNHNPGIKVIKYINENESQQQYQIIDNPNGEGSIVKILYDESSWFNLLL